MRQFFQLFHFGEEMLFSISNVPIQFVLLMHTHTCIFELELSVLRPSTIIIIFFFQIILNFRLQSEYSHQNYVSKQKISLKYFLFPFVLAEMSAFYTFRLRNMWSKHTYDVILHISLFDKKQFNYLDGTFSSPSSFSLERWLFLIENLNYLSRMHQTLYLILV